MTAEIRLLAGFALSLSRNRLDHSLLELLERHIEWETLIRLCDYNALLPVLSRGLQLYAPELYESPSCESLRDYRRAIERHNTRQVEVLGEVIARLRDASIEALAYKGPVLAQLTVDDFALREFSDLDILVPEPAYQRARMLLEASGFTCLGEDVTEAALIRHCGDERVSVDLHRKIMPPRMRDYRSAQDIWACARTVEILDHRIPTLSSEDTFLVTSLHLLKDWENRWPVLRYGLDVAVLADPDREIDRDSVLERARRQGIARAAELSFVAADQLLETSSRPKPGQVADRDTLPVSLQAALVKDFSTTSRRRVGRLFALYSLLSIRIRYWSSSGPLTWLKHELHSLSSRLFFVGPQDKRALPLPAGLHGLYYVIQPIRFVVIQVCRHLNRSKRELL